MAIYLQNMPSYMAPYFCAKYYDYKGEGEGVRVGEGKSSTHTHTLKILHKFNIILNKNRFSIVGIHNLENLIDALYLLLKYAETRTGHILAHFRNRFYRFYYRKRSLLHIFSNKSPGTIYFLGVVPSDHINNLTINF